MSLLARSTFSLARATAFRAPLASIGARSYSEGQLYPLLFPFFPLCSFLSFILILCLHCLPSWFVLAAGGENEPRFLEMVKIFFDQAAAKTNIDPDLLEIIKQCNSVYRVRSTPS